MSVPKWYRKVSAKMKVKEKVFSDISVKLLKESDPIKMMAEDEAWFSNTI
jgi:hypothetical protein